MFSKKISRRSFLKVSAVTTAMAAMGLPAFAAEDTAEENCFQTLNIPRATGSTVDKSVLLNESRLYLITDFGLFRRETPSRTLKPSTPPSRLPVRPAAAPGGGRAGALRPNPSRGTPAATTATPPNAANPPTASSGLPGQTCTTGMATRPW